MRLLWLDHDNQFKVTDDIQHNEPYAILSHTWGRDNDEVTFRDIRDGTGNGKSGWEKLKFIARRAHEARLKYFWVDTCCIHKDSDSELATAIRSMFRWYADAQACYVYLQDLPTGKRSHDGTELWTMQLRSCRWFTRGWTLQEMLAPKIVHFYSGDRHLGDRSSLCDSLHEITGVEKLALTGQDIDSFSYARRLQWAARRETKLPEDKAYCLMGLCGVSMSPRYGEGGVDAQQRLEAKVIKRYGTAAFSAGNRAVIAVEASREAKIQRLRFDVMDSRKQTIKKAMAKTCAWIYTHHMFQTWTRAQQERHGFFWIKGKPGTGKSVLMRFIDNHISSNKEKDDICISFYFNARGASLEKTFAGLYRSLLLQILLAEPSLQNLLDSIVSNFETDVEALQTLFLKACVKLRQRKVYCFIDALDECKEEDVSHMLEFFEDLEQAAADNSATILTCFASRHYPILEVPTRLQLVLEETDQHSKDLERYARQHLKLGSPRHIQQIIKDVLTKANGIFLWVVLVTEILGKEFKNGRVHAVKKRLETIPAGLTELFKDIILQDQENIDEFLLCLKWILYAKRPLYLIEFYFAMMVSIDGQGKWDQTMVDKKQMLRYVLSSSKGLAEMTKGKFETVQFIHESVRDFLITEEGFRAIETGQHASTAENHELLKQCCLRGLQDDDACRQHAGLIQSFCDARRLDQRFYDLSVHRCAITARFPFLDYATTFVLYHANEADSTGENANVPQHEFLDQFDIDGWLVKANLLQDQKARLYKPFCNLVYLCAERDLVNLLRTLASTGHSLTQSSPQRNDTPLFAAIANRSSNAACEILRQTGACNAQDIVKDVMDNHRGRSAYDRPRTEPWHRALYHGHLSLARHILSRHDFTTITDSTVGTALRMAAEQGCDDIAKLLLNTGFKVNSACSAALTFASQRGHVEMVNLLLRHGADVNSRHAPRALGNPLQAASENGYLDIVKLLVEEGAIVDAKRGSRGTALYLAASNRRFEVVKLLLEANAHVNGRSGPEGTVLQAAVKAGCIDTVRLLLDRGAIVNGNTSLGQTILQVAVETGCIEMVELLLDRDADVNAKSDMVGTVLDDAVSLGRVDIVRLLLDRGAHTSFGEVFVTEGKGRDEILKLLRRRHAGGGTP